MTAQRSQPLTDASPLYDQDFHLWLDHTATLLRENRLTELDIPNLLEEIEAMGRSERNALESNLAVVLLHLLKYKYQPELRSNSWRFTIREHRKRIRRSLKDSPSLQRYLEEAFQECYQDARELAADETGLSLEVFPVEPPFIQDEALNPDYLPD